MMIVAVILSGLSLILLLILLFKSNTANNINSLDIRLQHLQQQNTLLQNHLTEHLMKSFDLLRGQIVDTLKINAEATNKQVDKLTQQTELKLQEISGQVEKRLAEGFEKTTATFQDVIKRLALIDEAQKKITELSSNVINLQEILADKRSRGAFGEIQLSALVSNVLPENSYALQYNFPNNVRADCVLFLPEPSGTICIDAKFPLENYQRMVTSGISDIERTAAARHFKQDIKKHIHDIATKYIIPNETSDGAMMFIPAEAIFAEIHGHYPELVQESYRAKVWLVSPTTLMAILTTARAVIKDDATRKQMHIIQRHLGELGKDFERFQTRMTKLAQHIKQAHNDVESVHTSARKISSRFAKIEQVEFNDETVENAVLQQDINAISKKESQETNMKPD